MRSCAMDGDIKHLRVRFSGAGHEDHGSGVTIPRPSQQSTGFGRGLMSSDEYDTEYAAMVAAVAYAIAAREEKLVSQDKPVADKFASERKPVGAEKLAPGSRKQSASIDAPRATLPKRGKSLKRPIEGSRSSKWFSGAEHIDDDYDDGLGGNVSVRPRQKKPEVVIPDEKVEEKLAPGSRKQSASIDVPRATTPKRGESLKRPFEGSKSSKWFSGKEHIDDDYNDVPGVNVSVRKPFGPTQKRPDVVIPDEKVEEMLLAGSAPSNSQKALEKKRSRKFEPEQGNEVGSSSNRETGIPTPGMASSSEAQMMADAWEKEKMAKIKKKYNETMETIAEWEAEKKAKARRQKELKAESDSERKRANALEEYNEEMSRINKVAAASRFTAEEKRSNAERKVRDKAHMIRSTGKLPRTCGCF
ncbi:hypothetical protein BS78_01G276900 [Paspalum vaginatum]|nr:hypothetical protein BS78_01G276900 [Paspalum vaginatum]